LRLLRQKEASMKDSSSHPVYLLRCARCQKSNDIDTLLPVTRADLVQKGWWLNHTSPIHRRLLWTTTNLEAVVLFGLLGLLGAYAVDKSWSIICQLSQPTIHFPETNRDMPRVSQSKATKALWADLGQSKQELKLILTSGQIKLMRKVRAVVDVVLQRDRLRPRNDSIELRFRVLAIINFIGFAVYGIFVPFLLAEDRQGEDECANVAQVHRSFGWKPSRWPVQWSHARTRRH
jgi:hypothetical protein